MDRIYRNLYLKLYINDRSSQEQARKRLHRLIEKRDALRASKGQDPRRVKELERLERTIAQKDFRSEMEFAGMDYEPEGVVIVAQRTSIYVLFLSFLLLFFTIPFMNMSRILIASPLVLAAPVASFILLISYPEKEAKRAIRDMAGDGTEMVYYMAISLKQDRSLPGAIRFAMENTSGPLSRALRRIIWDVYTNEYESIEASFLAFTDRIGTVDSDLKSSLYALLESTMGRDRESSERGIERGLETALYGSKRKMQDFAASLSVPSTVLFGLGLILPLLIGTVLPLLSIGKAFSSFSPMFGSVSEVSGASTLILTVLLMDVCFPVIALLYARKTLSKRPAGAQYRIRPSAIYPVWPFFTFASAMVLFALWSSFNLNGNSLVFSLLASVSGASFSMGLYFYLSGKAMDKTMKMQIAVEDQLPDALFHIGIHMSEGRSMTYALKSVSRSGRGTEMSHLIQSILFVHESTGRTLGDVTFNEKDGILTGFGSQMVSSSFRTIFEMDRKDPQGLGKAVLSLSGHLRDMKKAEREIESAMGPVAENIKMTSTYLAPVIMGFTIGLYGMLLGTLSSGPEYGTDVAAFSVIMGLFLVMMVSIMQYFSSSLMNGGDAGPSRLSIGKGLMTAPLLYTASAIFSTIIIG